MPFDIFNTYTLLAAVEQIKPASTFSMYPVHSELFDHSSPRVIKTYNFFQGSPNSFQNYVILDSIKTMKDPVIDEETFQNYVILDSIKTY